MRLPLSWLTEFVDWSVTDPRAIAERLSLSTAEVEDIEEQGRYLRDVCVGRVTHLDKHPKADRLRVATVETDRGPVKVVCGGSNLRDGMLVAFAHVGAVVRHGDEEMTLKEVVIRGEPSHGMICAAEEIGLSDRYPPKPEDGERPIIDLSDSGFAPGSSLRQALGMDDVVFVISNTAITHRPDLFSIVGFARECVALGLGSWRREPYVALPTFPAGKLPFHCVVETDTITRYCACVIEIDGLGETPEWMRKRLEAAGWRGVNLPVDITNFVATEIGMPLHSFDADDLKGDVHMRESREGETITTLDEIERKLPKGAIVLSDDEGVFDLMGIMGGLRSSTKEGTRRLYLHSTVVDPRPIRRAMLATGHRTDAGTVYEKGIPNVAAPLGLARALELILQLVPGAKIVSEMSGFGDDGAAEPIHLSLPKMQSLLGLEIPVTETTRILEALECTVKKGKADELIVTPPLHRLRDLKTPTDLAEEVARIHGYDQVKEAMPPAELRHPERPIALHRLRDALRSKDYWETCPLSLVGPALLKRAGFDPARCERIENALGEDTSLYQPSLLPGLLQHAAAVQPGLGSELKTFQVGHTALTDRAEVAELALLLCPKGEPALADLPLLRLLSDLTSATGTLHRSITVSPLASAPAWAHPGRASSITLDGIVIGTAAELHPTVLTAFDLPARSAALSLELPALVGIVAPGVTVKPLGAFPAIAYDTTVKADATLTVGPLLERLKSADPLVETAEVADLYVGPQHTGGAYNLTLRLTYRSPERTLTEAEVQTLHEKLIREVVALPVV